MRNQSGINNNNFKHGGKGSRLYSIWKDMRRRCTNKIKYPNWAGRGISFCYEWNDFVSFKTWAMSNGYNDNLTIDRIDNNGNYQPNNCRWVTKLVQGNNKRNNIIYIVRGKKMTAREISIKYDIPYSRFRDRVHKLKWTINKAIKEPKINQYG